jgi:hypothetical protein
MTTGLPARVAICAVMLTAQLAGPVRADVPPHAPLPRAVVAPADPVVAPFDRRQVAVIDLSEDDQVRLLSGALYEAIFATDTMMVPNKRGFDTYLTGPLYDEDAEGIENAKTARAAAMSDLDEANSGGADAKASNGLAYLARVMPSTDIQMMYADLSFLAGLAALDQGRAQDANLALALTHRLDPARQLSDARWPPNTIAAYKRAVESKPQLVTIEVKLDPSVKRASPPTDVRVWIDFVDRGPLGSFDGIEVGDHVITIVGPTILTTGTPRRISGPTTVPLNPIDARPEDQVRRARLALSRAQAQHDDAARAAAMKRLATLLGVGDAVMISKRPDGALQWETWRDRAPGFSAPQAYTKDQKPDDILEGLGPLHKPQPPRFVGPPLGKLPITVETPWYQERWIQASVGAGVVAVIVGSILIATHTRDLQFGPDIKDLASTSTAR